MQYYVYPTLFKQVMFYNFTKQIGIFNLNHMEMFSCISALNAFQYLVSKIKICCVFIVLYVFTFQKFLILNV